LLWASAKPGRSQIEGAAPEARKDEHSGHPEDVLQSQERELRRRQLIIDADIEDARRRRCPVLRYSPSHCALFLSKPHRFSYGDILNDGKRR
jgi:hypothetical protein